MSRTRTPRRIQLSRRAGRKLPETARSVARPTKWGNPFIQGRDGDHDEVVELHRRWVTDGGLEAAGLDVAELYGLDLACWCRPDQTCHADTLLERAAASGRRP